jgi:hypothetical protein
MDPVSTDKIDLHAMHSRLSAYGYFNRFGGRYRVACIGLYRVSRKLVVSILNDLGDIHTDRTDAELFTAVVGHHPEFQYRLSALDALRPFVDRQGVEPFDPTGQVARQLVEDLHKAATDLLMLAMADRMEAEEKS